jgi:hypothetical protein
MDSSECPTGIRLLASYLIALEQYRRIVASSPLEWNSETADILTDAAAEWLQAVQGTYAEHIAAHGCHPKIAPVNGH